jgi:hypothetical protein
MRPQAATLVDGAIAGGISLIVLLLAVIALHHLLY